MDGELIMLLGDDENRRSGGIQSHRGSDGSHDQAPRHRRS